MKALDEDNSLIKFADDCSTGTFVQLSNVYLLDRNISIEVWSMANKLW